MKALYTAKVMRFVVMASILLVIVTTATAAVAMSNENTGVKTEEHLRGANPSKEVQMKISMRGKKLLQDYPDYVNLIYTDTTTILVCTDVRCNGVTGPTAVAGIFDKCRDRHGCSCSNEGDLDSSETMNGFYCLWVDDESDTDTLKDEED